MKSITFNPETHKLVPLEPTEEMINEGNLRILAGYSAEYAYKEMLNAAPAASDSVEEAPQQEPTCNCTSPWAHDQCVDAPGCKIKKKLSKQQPATHGEPVGEVTVVGFGGAFKVEFNQTLLAGTKLYTSPQPTPELVQAANQMIQAWSDCSGYPDTPNEVEQIENAVTTLQNALPKEGGAI